MISEGSRDTDDLNNDAENSVLHHSKNKTNKKSFLIQLKTVIISQYHCFTLF